MGRASFPAVIRIRRVGAAFLRLLRGATDAGALQDVSPMPVRKDSIIVAYPHRGRIAHLVRVRSRAQHGWKGAAECRPGDVRLWLPVPPWLTPGAVLCPACVAHAATCVPCAEALRRHGR